MHIFLTMLIFPQIHFILRRPIIVTPNQESKENISAIDLGDTLLQTN